MRTSGLTPGRTAVTAILCLLGSGCLIVSNNEKVVASDARRVTVEFENEQALETFQTSVEQRYRAGGNKVGNTSLAIPFVMAVSEKKVLSENAFYNAQVSKADADGDGKITESEARVYAKT